MSSEIELVEAAAIERPRHSTANRLISRIKRQRERVEGAIGLCPPLQTAADAPPDRISEKIDFGL